MMVGFCLQAVAQFPPRSEDHFWRRKVVNRIDLSEKVNAPLIKRESYRYTDGQYAETEGLILALFNGLKAGKYNAYNPDSLSKPMSYEAVLRRIQEIEGSLSGEADFDADYSMDDTGGDGGFDDFGGDAGTDDWGFADDGFGGDDFADDLGGDPLLEGGGGFGGGDFDPAPFESVIQFVENRIFDKNRSDMIYDIELIEVIWTDPGEALPEKYLCTFRYDEVLETLDNTQWKNRFNDAEYKTLREVFEMRLFHSYITDVSGVGVRTLEESESRRQQLVEFEHHLWSY